MSVAIEAAYRMNRFAAMDTCRDMVRGVRNEELGIAVNDIILQYRDTFISHFEASDFEDESIKDALRQIQQERET